MAQLNAVLAASLDKMLQKESAGSREGSSKMYLRDAAMSRMTYILKNSTEKIGVVGLNYNVPKQSDSDMSPDERAIIKQWATGVSSGRYAMVAFLDCRRQNRKQSLMPKPADSRPLGVMTSSINFPLEYLSHESLLYEECFGRPPAGVLREALQMLTSKAMEDSPMSLTSEQIDLAWRQMKIERLGSRVVLAEDAADMENVDPNVADVNPDFATSDTPLERRASSKRMSVDLSAPANESNSIIALEVMMEMVRMFHAGELSSVRNESLWLDEEAPGRHSVIDVKDVEQHLEMPLQQVVEEAKKLSTEDLDSSNARLKNYVASLSSLKQELAKKLEHIEDTAMYATLGISPDTSEAQLKKAYHAMAIKLHPDRKGGDTQKFQQLQTAYQEIQKKRRIDGSAALHETSAADRTEALSAESLMVELAELLDTVKVAAEQCAMLAQLCIQGQKMMESAASDPSPIASMNALLTEGTSLGKISQQVIEPLETGCEYMQSIAAKAMVLPTLGAKFANATAIVGGFTRCVERTMSAGLDSLRSVTEVMSADLQLSVCRQKLSRMLMDEAVDKTASSALAEAVLRTFKGVCAAMCVAAEKAVRAAEMSAELIDTVASIVARADLEVVADRKRQAERAEKENHRDAGDAEDATPREEPEESKAPVPQEEEEESGDVVETLMRKVKALQLQLRVQNVQSMQTLNSTAVEMQRRLHDELAKIDMRTGLSPGIFEAHVDSILTLIAEIVDGSCNSLHLECDAGNVRDAQAWSDSMQQHLGWMRLKSRLKIALLPDLRARTLWFGALADLEALRTIIAGELPSRLCDCVRRAQTSCAWAVASAEADATPPTLSMLPSRFVQGRKVALVPEIQEVASAFCSEIMRTIDSLRKAD